jgi:CBS domain-containing protein
MTERARVGDRAAGAGSGAGARQRLGRRACGELLIGGSSPSRCPGASAGRMIVWSLRVKGKTMNPAASTSPTISVSTVMHHGMVNTPPQTPLTEVAAQMAHHCVHCVVVDGLARGPRRSEKLVWGILSDLDLMKAAAAGAMEETAGEHAGTELTTIYARDTVDHAAQLMAEHESTHLVVVSPETGMPIGVISSLDVAGALAPPLDRSPADGA